MENLMLFASKDTTWFVAVGLVLVALAIIVYIEQHPDREPHSDD